MRKHIPSLVGNLAFTALKFEKNETKRKYYILKNIIKKIQGSLKFFINLLSYFRGGGRRAWAALGFF